MKHLVLLGFVMVALAACGDEDPPAAPPPAAIPATPARPGGAAQSKNGQPGGKPLTPMVHIEDRVNCPTPTNETSCDPQHASKCGPGLYCLTAQNGNFCGKCPERDGIRVTFKPRDFTPVENRDPFQSFIITQPGLGPEPEHTAVADPSAVCVRKEQLVATSYSFRDLKLVGIVAQGTQRKALMLDNAQFGNIIKKGDCVGREKALVKEIGAGYITFIVSPDPTNPNQRDPEELSVQLYPEELSPAAQDQPTGNGVVIAAPPAGTAKPKLPAPAPSVGPVPPPPSDVFVPAPPK